MKNLLASIGQLLFPNLCVCCDGYLSNQELHVCDLCSYTLPRFEMMEVKDNPLGKKLWGRLQVEFATAYLSYKSTNDVKKILHELKYKGNAELGIELGRWLGRALAKIDAFGKIDYIVPIPLHPARQRIRGYNQSELLGIGVSEALQIPQLVDVVSRERYNSTQTRKRRYERYINSKELFKVREPQKVENKHILLLDDVITTGSTIESCGSVLKDVEGLTLSVVSLAAAT